MLSLRSAEMLMAIQVAPVDPDDRPVGPDFRPWPCWPCWRQPTARAKGARSDLGLTGLGMIVSWPDRRQMRVPRGAVWWIAVRVVMPITEDEAYCDLPEMDQANACMGS